MQIMSFMKIKYTCPNSAISALVERLSTTGNPQKSVPDEPIYGRVLGENITADRHSPAADLSAMDGYAINNSDLEIGSTLPIQGESKAGSPAPPLHAGTAVRIFTGAIIPENANQVIKRENTIESESTIQIKPSSSGYPIGCNIRRAGENAAKGEVVLRKGEQINGANASTLANFGYQAVKLFPAVKISIITTGDEVGKFDHDEPKPWQIRDSNLQSLRVLFQGHPWIHLERLEHCSDDRELLLKTMKDSLSDSDALIMTGGVSVGDYDYVPQLISELDAKPTFHGLPIRPGKPILGAANSKGQLILGLPGNPVSALVGCYRIGMPLLRYIAGFTEWNSAPAPVNIANPDTKTLPMHWYRLVKQNSQGELLLCANQGSGDLVSLGGSSGFIEVQPNHCGEGPWPYYAWN